MYECVFELLKCMNWIKVMQVSVTQCLETGATPSAVRAPHHHGRFSIGVPQVVSTGPDH